MDNIYVDKIASPYSLSNGYGTFLNFALEWKTKVMAGGCWDYKINPDKKWMPETGIFIMYGELISLADFGNVNYGYTGTIIGFGEVSLYSGGGWAAGKNTEDAPLYGDSQVDHYFIEKGINQASGLGFDGKMYNFDVRGILSILKEGKGAIRDFVDFFGNVYKGD